MNAIKELFTGKSFDFYTPYKLDEAKHELYDVYVQTDTPLVANPKTFFVDITDKDEFRCWRNYGKGMRLQCSGRFEEHSDGVSVQGRIYLNFMMKYFLLGNVFFVVWTMAIRIDAFAFFVIGLVLWTIYDFIRKQQQFYQTIFDALSKSKKKKNDEF